MLKLITCIQKKICTMQYICREQFYEHSFAHRCTRVDFVVCSQKDLDLFLEHTRAKFVGFQVKNDRRSLAGLPQPIHEGVKVLNQVGR